MTKYSVAHPDTGHRVVVYRMKDICKEYKFETKRAKLFPVHHSKDRMLTFLFTEHTGAGCFFAKIGCGRPARCVVAKKFDEFIRKAGWKTDAELLQEEAAPKSASKPEQTQMQPPLPNREEPAPGILPEIVASPNNIVSAITAGFNNIASVIDKRKLWEVRNGEEESEVQ